MDSTIQQAEMLKVTCGRHAADGTTNGIPDNQIQTLSVQTTGASQKDTNQKNAIEIVSSLTVRQNELIKKGDSLVVRTREAAKGAYGEDDRAKMNEFHVGNKIPVTVKGLISELRYTGNVASSHKTDLANHGIKDEQIGQLTGTADELSSVDSEQEAAKKKQKAATKERDTAMKALQKTIRKIQHTAKSVFADQPSVLIEFESITKRRGPGGQKNASPPAGPPAQ
ncbi:MAG: hypothetical protein M1395_04915 [Bacteroidetes bacterium]|nr:hypothetical protein [Bacteroidota bacterium]